MNKKQILLLSLGLLTVSQYVAADPCGMVPPISVKDSDTAILRTGIQRTYVFFRNGIETIALRPGFSGTVDDFGMLIPFPSPPALRKIDDNTFAHIEAALEPPKVQVRFVSPVYRKGARGRRAMAVPTKAGSGEPKLSYNEVKVLNQEAVGMYQVAVLAAGSAAALQKWMRKNGYRYPQGMDNVANEYIADKWCFVAIKAMVGQAPGVEPKPGMQNVDSKRPAGSTFNGYVQGMAFRFHSKEPVIPMRLSVFNGEGPKNVVYALTDKPVRIHKVPTKTVVRQLSGKQLHNNVMKKLEVIYKNGQASEVPESRRMAIEQLRDPSPFMKAARELFAADMLAVREGKLSLAHEDTEKQLLRISESFGLRGEAIDQLHNTVLTESKKVAVDGALGDLYEMNFSVIEGVYPGTLLANENLRLVPYKMSKTNAVERQDPLRPSDLHLSIYR